jgi:hypothetical protein
LERQEALPTLPQDCRPAKQSGALAWGKILQQLLVPNAEEATNIAPTLPAMKPNRHLLGKPKKCPILRGLRALGRLP